jgi:hypothetical protein
MGRTTTDFAAVLGERWNVERNLGRPPTLGKRIRTMSKLEFTGTKEMRITAMITTAVTLKMDKTRKFFKSLVNATTKDKEAELIQYLDSSIWTDFLLQADGMGKNFRRAESDRVRLCGSIEKGYRMVLPYNPANPKAVSLELWRNKEVLSIHVDADEELRIFGRILYKLGGNPSALKEPVEINGEVLKLGHWVAAFTCKAMDDEAGYMMYHDEGLDKL